MTDTLAQWLAGALLVLVAGAGYYLGYRAGRRKGGDDAEGDRPQPRPGRRRPPKPPTRIH